MKIDGLDDRGMAKVVKKLFGRGVMYNRKGKYCLVHLDRPAQEKRAEREQRFAPELFFDPKCPHCRPFLEDGAMMVYDGKELVGMRVLHGRMVEAVCLKEPSALAN